MAVISVNAARAYASVAGFRGRSLDIIVAIARAESGLDTRAINTAGNSAGVDRGILQINSHYHPTVSDAQAFDPQFSFQYGYRISQSGTNFRPWAAYNNGSYQKYLQPITGGSANHVFPIVGYQGPIGLHWQSHKGASDLPSINQPVVAMTNGRVTITRSEDRKTGGGGNTITYQGDDGLMYHYAHLRDFPLVNVGARVRTGQAIGYTGNSGIRDMTGHLHVGIGKTIMAGWGPHGGAGTDFDAVSFLRQLHNATPDVPTGTGPTPVTNCYTVFAGKNYTGKSREICGDMRRQQAGSWWDDPTADIQSIRLPPGMTITIYRQGDFVGNSKVYSSSIPDLTVDFPKLPNGAVIGSIQVSSSETGTPGSAPRFGLPLGGGLVRIGYNVNQTLAEVPGFAGMCLALDQAESFPGIITYESGLLDPGGTGAAIRSAGATIIANLIALTTRSIIFMLGLILFIGLVNNLVKATTGISAAGIATRGVLR